MKSFIEEGWMQVEGKCFAGILVFIDNLGCIHPPAAQAAVSAQGPAEGQNSCSSAGKGYRSVWPCLSPLAQCAWRGWGGGTNGTPEALAFAGLFIRGFVHPSVIFRTAHAHRVHHDDLGHCAEET